MAGRDEARRTFEPAGSGEKTLAGQEPELRLGSRFADRRRLDPGICSFRTRLNEPVRPDRAGPRVARGRHIDTANRRISGRIGGDDPAGVRKVDLSLFDSHSERNSQHNVVTRNVAPVQILITASS